MAQLNKHVDTIIIGAGISGIGIAVHLKNHFPKRNFIILERRNEIAGTWSLFKYPGIRSDSDMTTFGYKFKPWKETSVLAQASSICNYLQETVDEYQLNSSIQFNTGVVSANWNSASKVWELEVVNTQTNAKELITANFVVSCTGYYNYDQGYMPKYIDQDKFKGTLIHPQHWPENLDYTGKKVVIIGSGATAITLAPSMAPTAGHVTVLQRSPTYIASIPAIDFVYNKMRDVMPEDLAYKITRGRNIALQRFAYAASRSKPDVMKKYLLKMVKRQVGDKVDMKHFTPNYNPWDQRLCVVPNGDLFKSIKKGQVTMETDHIERFVENGIILKSGKLLEADIIISATGLQIQIMGGIKGTINGQEIRFNDKMLYRGIMASDVPNFGMVLGYINASWTLKVDIVGEYLCRLWAYMEKHNYDVVTPKGDPSAVLDEAAMGGLQAGYIQRSADAMPRQGKKQPWVISMNYLEDRKTLKKAKFDDGVLKFQKGAKKGFKLFRKS